jgi:hypothetical protein
VNLRVDFLNQSNNLFLHGNDKIQTQSQQLDKPFYNTSILISAFIQSSVEMRAKLSHLITKFAFILDPLH